MTSSSKLPGFVNAEIKAIQEIASFLWTREWAERNAGNISLDFSDHFADGEIPSGSPFVPCVLPPEVAGLTLFVTGKGCYLRHLIDSTEEAACILQIDDKASGYHLLWGGKSKNFSPTSELLTHVKIHHFNRTEKPTHKAVLHTHPPELIVLSHHDFFQDEEKFNHSLWKMCPEIRVFVARGIHCAPYALTGSASLAELTIKGLRTRDVILWEKHGALSTGEDISKAYDFLDVANKGARMLLMAWAAGFDPKGLSPEEMRELEQFF